jgi:glutaredoxin
MNQEAATPILKPLYNQPMHSVVVYSRVGCCLCDVVKQTLASVQSNAAEQGADFEWRDVDIDADPELRRKYNDEIPVVFIDGRRAFKYRMSEPDFLRALAGRCASSLAGEDPPGEHRKNNEGDNVEDDHPDDIDS